MSWLRGFLLSSIGCKVVMAVTGVALVGFLVTHLAGNLLVWAGPEAINNYAKTLRDYLPLLWALRIGLLAAFVLHIAAGVRLSYLNKKAKPKGYQVKDPVDSSFSSRSMALSGLVVLAFVLYHLAHLTFRLTHSEFAQLGPYDVYSMLLLSFSSAYVTSFYCIGVILLMVHLNHGLWSLFQTLGFNHPKYNATIRSTGIGLSVALALGFLSVPVSIFFGIIK